MTFRLVGTICDARKLFGEAFHMIMEYLELPLTLAGLWMDFYNFLSPAAAMAVCDYTGAFEYVLGCHTVVEIPQQEPITVFMVRTQGVDGGGPVIEPLTSAQGLVTSAHLLPASEQHQDRQPLTSAQTDPTSRRNLCPPRRIRRRFLFSWGWPRRARGRRILTSRGLSGRPWRPREGLSGGLAWGGPQAWDRRLTFPLCLLRVQGPRRG